MTDQQARRMLTVAQAAPQLRTSPYALRNQCRNHQIPEATKPAGTWLIPEDVVAQLARQQQEDEPA